MLSVSNLKESFEKDIRYDLISNIRLSYPQHRFTICLLSLHYFLTVVALLFSKEVGNS